MSFKKCKVVMLSTNQKAIKGDIVLNSPNNQLMIMKSREKHSNYETIHVEGSSFYEWDKAMILHHLYFITDEKPSEVGDWFIVKLCNDKNEEYLSLEQVGTIFDGWINNSFKVNTRHIDNCYKVIATTNDNISINLGKERWVAPTNPLYDLVYTRLSPFPKPSKSFIDKFIEMYNKKPITECLIEYTKERRTLSIEDKKTPNGTDYKELEYEWIEELKVNSNNEITIKKIKDTFTREEVEKLTRFAFIAGESYGISKTREPDYYMYQDSPLNEFIKQNL